MGWLGRLSSLLKNSQVSIDEKLNSWLNENSKITREVCKQLLDQLKQRHLNPVLQKLRDKEGGKLVSYADVTEGYDRIEEEYKKSARGAKDTISEVYSKFHPVRDTYCSRLSQNTVNTFMFADYDNPLLTKILMKKVIVITCWAPSWCTFWQTFRHVHWDEVEA